MTEVSYEGDVKINQDDMDGEWIKQPALYVYWATKYAEALAVKDRIWLEKRILKANLYKNAKAISEGTGKKITDTGIDAEIRSSPEYKEISLKLIDAEEEVNKLDAIKWALQNKMKALENLSKTDEAGFNMKDSFSEEIKSKVENSIEQDKEARKNLKLRKQ